MILPLKRLALAGGLLMVTACASTIEPDGRLEAARDRVDAAAEFGTSRSSYTRATGFLSEAEAALEAGDERVYDKSVELGDAYAQVAIAEGQADEARDVVEAMEGELSDAEAMAARLEADLEAARAANRTRPSNMSQTLSLLAGAMKCTMTDRGSGTVALSCPGLGFGFDQSQLSVAADARMSALAQFLDTYGGVAVELVGHTDSIGPEGWNQSLSERRAEAAAAVLRGEDISAGRITTSGQGESQPIAGNDTRAGRAQNRRVDVILRGVTTAGSMAESRDI